MNRYNSEKLKLKLFTKEFYILTGLLIGLVLMFILDSSHNKNISFLFLFSNDYFLWVLLSFILSTLNRAELVESKYFELSRIGTKSRNFKNNSMTVVLGTAVYSFFLFFVALVMEYIVLGSFNRVDWFKFNYLLIRYFLILCFIQCVLYIIVNVFDFFKKSTIMINFIPIVLFFILTFPQEFMSSMYGINLNWLDFSALGLLKVSSSTSLPLSALFWGNLNIFVIIIWMFLAYKWFYLDKEEYS